MTKNEILQFLNANPICHLATVEGDQPRVRGMMMYRADAVGIIFHTGSIKDLYRQLLKNNHVEICFHSPDMSQQIRVQGIAEILDDLNLKKEIIEARPFMKPWIEQHGYESMVVFRVTRCKASTWSMQSNFEPTKFVEI
jgi:pyridoxamine 5'-phosphate oxidase